MTMNDVCRWLQQFAPLETAAEWDNVGLLLGDRQQVVTEVLTCLTVTPEVVQEAIERPVQLIVTHHPILFKGAKKLSLDQADGRLVWPLAKHGIAVYSPHTAFDNATRGINALLCDALGVLHTKPLRPKPLGAQFKIIVFVPTNDVDKVFTAMADAGAGVIGQYNHCSFRTPGRGSFIGNDSTNPVIGQKGQLEFVDEFKLEMVCPGGKLKKVVQAMIASHPYEEVAHDVIALHPVESKSGEGRIGQLKEAMPIGYFAQVVRQALGAPAVEVIGEMDQQVKTVAVACGAAGEYLSDALSAKADVFLTGEARFHDHLRAKEAGIGLVLPGHYASERFALERLATIMSDELPGLKVMASSAETNPSTWVI